MKRLSINEWLDDEKISMMLSEKEIETIKAEYKYFFEDEPIIFECDGDDTIRIKTGFPLIETFFEDVKDYFTNDIECEKDYVYRYAEYILKCHILCACQIFFGFPLWQDKDLIEYREPIKDALQNINKVSAENEDEFAFPCFFPYYSNEYILYPRFMLQWIYDAINEFFDIAESNMYHLSLEEQIKEKEESKRELKKLEDFLLGNRDKF